MSPPHLQDNAWCPSGSKAISGQSRQQIALVVLNQPPCNNCTEFTGVKMQARFTKGRTEIHKWTRKQRQREGELYLLKKLRLTNY